MDDYNYSGKESLLSIITLHLAIIEFLFFSGGVYVTNVYFGKESIAYIVFCLTSFLHFVSVNNASTQTINLRKWFFITFWVLGVTYIFGQGTHDLTLLKHILPSVGVLLLVSSTEFSKIRTLLLKYLSFITVLSIIIQLDHDFVGVFPSIPYENNSGVITYYTYIFNTEWGGDESRLSSIYWEPGQYQVVIFYILALFADEWSDISAWKLSVKKFGVLILALIMTLSTTAYLLLMLMMLIIVFRNGVKHIRLLPIYLILGGVVVFLLYRSEAVQKKVEQSEFDNERSSYTIRMADNLGCLMVTLEDPITGYGAGSSELEGRLLSAGSETSSNGWLYGSAQLGIPYIVFLWICIWGVLRRMNPKTNTFLLFSLLVISQSNEAGISFPYMYMYIFTFPEYGKG